MFPGESGGHCACRDGVVQALGAVSGLEALARMRLCRAEVCGLLVWGSEQGALVTLWLCYLQARAETRGQGV